MDTVNETPAEQFLRLIRAEGTVPMLDDQPLLDALGVFEDGPRQREQEQIPSRKALRRHHEKYTDKSVKRRAEMLAARRKMDVRNYEQRKSNARRSMFLINVKKAISAFIVGADVGATKTFTLNGVDQPSVFEHIGLIAEKHQGKRFEITCNDAYYTLNKATIGKFKNRQDVAAMVDFDPQSILSDSMHDLYTSVAAAGYLTLTRFENESMERGFGEHNTGAYFKWTSSHKYPLDRLQIYKKPRSRASLFQCFVYALMQQESSTATDCAAN